MTASLTLTYGSLDLTASPYLIEFGTDVGAPQNEVEALAFLLQDGEVELSNRASNRTLQFNVLIEGGTLADLAEAEAALLAETEKPLNTITVDPGDDAAATVFQVFRGQVVFVRDDAWEMNGLRRYTVTVKALPFGRSSSQVTVTGIAPGGSTTTSLDTCSATTGWAGTVDGVSATVTTASGSVLISSGSVAGTHTLIMQKTFAATTSTTNLLMVDWQASPASGASFQAIGDGVFLQLAAEGPSPTAGYTRSWFTVAASSLAVTQFRLISDVHSTGWGGSVRTLRIDNVAVTNVRPVSGTARQQLVGLSVSGTARAQASLAIESTTAALGNDTLVYVYDSDTATNGYIPSLRPFISGSATATDSTLVSGAYNSLSGSGVTFIYPLSLLPRGTYLLMVRLGSSAGTVTETINSAFNTKIGTSINLQSGPSLTVTGLTTTYKTFVMGKVQLPGVDLDDTTSATVEISFDGDTVSGVRLDEAWLFHTELGRLIWVDCGTGAGAAGTGNARRLFIDPASVDKPRPSLLMGHSADRSDAFFPPSLHCWQFPEFNPEQANALVVTPNATDAAVGLRYPPSWHFNAGS